MHGARSVPPPRKDEQANEEIQKSDNAQIIFNGDWLVRWGGDQPGFKFLAIAGELVAKLGPKPGPVQAVCHHCRPGHCNVVDRQQDVARMYSSGGGRWIRGKIPTFPATQPVRPPHTPHAPSATRTLHTIY